MSSGFDGFDFDAASVGNEENMYPKKDWVQWTLNLPMAKDRVPGEQWYYFTAGAVLLGDILDKSVPYGLEKYAHKNLFEPLGITNYQWQYTPQKVPNTADGTQLTPLGFAKFGQLYKNRGSWKEQQILTAKWVDESLSQHYSTTIDGLSYGYYWWHKKYIVGNEEYETYFCSGNGGNKIFVFVDQPLVIVVTASAYGKSYGHKQVDDMMEKFILPAVSN